MKKGEYHFQEVFFNGHPANKKNPHPPPPRRQKKTEPPPSQPVENNAPKPVQDSPKPVVREHKKKKHGFLKFILILILLAVLTLIAGAFIIISRIEYARDIPDHAAVVNAVGELKSDSQVYNIMIFGQDKHADNEYGRADTMLLISIDKKHHILKQTA